MISRKRLHRANQVALKHYRVNYWWDGYVWDKSEYIHDVWGKERALPIDCRMFGMYRKTRVFKKTFTCNCYWCLGVHRSRRQWRSDISFKEQLRDVGVI